MSNIQTMTNYQLCLRLMGHFAPYRLVLTLALLSTTLVAITNLVIPIFIKPMLDSIFVSRNYDSMQFIPLIIIVLFIVRNLSDFISNYGVSWIRNTLTVDLQTKIIDRLLMLPTHYFGGQTSEDLVLKITSDVTQITQDGVRAIFSFIKNVLTTTGLSLWMFYLNWELSILVLIIAPIVLLIVQIIYSQSHDIYKRKYQTTENFIQVIRESIKNHKTIVLNGGQQHVYQDFQYEANRIRQLNIKHTNTTIFKEPLIHIIIAIALSTIFYLAIQQTFTDVITIGSFVSFIVSLLILSISLEQLTKANKSLQNSLASMKDIFSVLDLEAESDNGKIILDHTQGELRFEQVSFYSDLKDFSLTIGSGEKIALISSSDNAVNSLINLIPRFIQPTNGKILFDNHELTTIKLGSLRSKIGVLTQETTIFNDSIAANIAYGEMRHSTESKIISAAHAAHAIEFIKKMPKGMQTLIGKHGIKLSREQRLHIAIARTLLKDPSILILDEIDTVLNPELECLIRSALNNLMRNRTTIIITQRKATLENVDRIIVIEHNRIAETGNHQKLFSEKGLYTKLYQLCH